MPGPNHAELTALFRQGFAAHQAGQVVEAAQIYRRILHDQPRHFDALHLLGVIAMQTGNAAEADKLIGQAIEIDPSQPVPFNNRGVAQQALRQFGPALESFDRALALQSGYAEAHYNRANTLRDMQRFEDALTAYDKAIALKPDYAEAFLNRGIEFARRDENEKALIEYENVIRIRPGFAEAYYNKGNALRALLRLPEGLEAFNRALALKPDLAEAYTARGMLKLLAGELEAGFSDYEWRWRTPEFGTLQRVLPKTPWRGGEDIRDKTVLLYAEQGLGDTIQFCRYAPMVAALGAKVVLEVQAPLKPLLSTLAGVQQIVAKGEPLPAFDMHCPLLSLPHALKTTFKTIPHSANYLSTEPERLSYWSGKIGQKSGMRIGLSWSGNAGYGLDRHRSVELDQFAPLLKFPAEFVALQKDLRPCDRGIIEDFPNLKFFGEKLRDFADTAALTALCDLVISVDTVAVHLAGALDKPAWIMLPFVPDWRWMLAREDSPWYPKAKLYRQSASQDWISVIARVSKELEHQFLML